MPRNSPVGIFLAFFAVLLGFAMIWRIYWLALFGLIGIVTVCIVHAWRPEEEVEVSVEKIRAHESGVAGGAA